MQTRIKICGITSLEDAQFAIKAGADALGFVFYPPSPRHIDLNTAITITHQLPPFITTTALFVNAKQGLINQVINQARIDCIQFHGDESPEACNLYHRPWIKAIRMKPEIDLIQLNQDYQQASALLLDSYIKGIPGGTGAQFNWSKIPPVLRPHIILAGGLTPLNISQAVEQVQPWAVDVSGGVEKQKGVKDHDKIRQFIQAVRASNYE